MTVYYKFPLMFLRTLSVNHHQPKPVVWRCWLTAIIPLTAFERVIIRFKSELSKLIYMVEIVNPKIMKYIREQLQAGYNIDAIKNILIDSGYNPNEVNQAINNIQLESKQAAQQSVQPAEAAKAQPAVPVKPVAKSAASDIIKTAGFTLCIIAGVLIVGTALNAIAGKAMADVLVNIITGIGLEGDLLNIIGLVLGIGALIGAFIISKKAFVGGIVVIALSAVYFIFTGFLTGLIAGVIGGLLTILKG